MANKIEKEKVQVPKSLANAAKAAAQATRPTTIIAKATLAKATPAKADSSAKTAAPKNYSYYYNKYMNGANTSAYDNMARNYARSVDQSTAQQIADANKAAQGQLRQAYVTRMQDQIALNNNLANAGIRGGATETSNMRLMNQYGNTRGQINSQLASSINDINRTAQQNKLAYQQDIDAKKQAYLENRQAEARQAAREEVNNARNRKIQKQQFKQEKKVQNAQLKMQKQQAADTHKTLKRTQNIEKYTAKYSKYFDTKKLQKMLKKTKDPIAKQIINARIGYLKSPEYKVAEKNAK